MSTTSSTAGCPKVPQHRVGEFALHSAHYPKLVWQCVARIPLPCNPGQCGNVQHKIHGPAPLENAAVCCAGSTAYSPKARRLCAVGVFLPTAPRQCGIVSQELQYAVPTAPRQCQTVLQVFH